MAKKKSGSKWTQPTTFSKFLAMLLFILLPLFFFWFGMQLQSMVDTATFSTLVSDQQQVAGPTPTSVPGQF